MENDRVFQTIHNYIDVGYKILRKGSVSARNGERLIIPINMRDGVLLCKGKGNEDWNYSAPHGAGRVMSERTGKRTDIHGRVRKVHGRNILHYQCLPVHPR